MKLIDAQRKPRPEPEKLPPYFEIEEEEVSTIENNASFTSGKPQTEENEPSPANAEETKDQSPKTNASVGEASAEAPPLSDS